MPHVDGFTLAGWVRGDPRLDGTALVMLTSGDRPDDAARCAESGIAAHLLKPVKQSELLEAIEVALGVAVRRPAAAEAAPAAAGVAGRRILLAEDSLVNQKLALALLKERGHRVSLVTNGRDAVAATEACPFDLVLMDVQMPDMDGLEAASAIRDRELRTGGHVPIVAMTAHALKGDRERCLAAGMDGYIAKPIRAAELHEAIARHARPAAAAEPPPPPLPERKIVDWSEALRSVQGNQATLRSMAEVAVEEVPKLFDDIRRAVSVGDALRLRLAAHTLRGSVRYFGLGPTYEHADALERLAETNDLSEAGPVLALLKNDVDRFTADISGYLRAGGNGPARPLR